MPYLSFHGLNPQRSTPRSNNAFLNGVALAGDYLTPALFLGLCGLVAFYGYDGALYCAGLIAGWFLALLLVAPALQRGGVFARVADLQLRSPALRRAAALSSTVIALFLLVPQIILAADLLAPLMNFRAPFAIFLAAAIMFAAHRALTRRSSTPALAALCMALLLLFCGLLAYGVLSRGLAAKPADRFPRRISTAAFAAQLAPTDKLLPSTGPWAQAFLARVQHPDGSISVWKFQGMQSLNLQWPAATFTECQLLTRTRDGSILINNLPLSAANHLLPAGFINRLPEKRSTTGPLGLRSLLSTLQTADIALPRSLNIVDADGDHTVYFPLITPGSDLFLPGLHPTLFPNLLSGGRADRLDFFSLMLALFCGAASLPQFFSRYISAGESPAARSSAVIATTVIGIFSILALYLGLGAVVSGDLDPGNSNLTLPLLAKSFGPVPFALFSLLALLALLYSAANIINATAPVIAIGLPSASKPASPDPSDRPGMPFFAAFLFTALAALLAIAFHSFNAAFLVGWAFNIAAAANLPAILMLLFWKRATHQGITASIIVGLITSLGWILLSGDSYTTLYGLPAASALVPFSQPGLITLPLSFIVLIVVSLMTKNPTAEDGVLTMQSTN